MENLDGSHSDICQLGVEIGVGGRRDKRRKERGKRTIGNHQPFQYLSGNCMSCEVYTHMHDVNSKMSIHRGNRSHPHAQGATSIIRDKLGFKDEAMWKRFSSRRLQLVESLSMSSKKASEQDEEIKICAKTLMKEFGFPHDTLPEFDKLVRLAIQSVRRNKRRSEKRLASKLETLTSDDEVNNKRIKLDDENDLSSNPSSNRLNDEIRNNNHNNVVDFSSYTNIDNEKNVQHSDNHTNSKENDDNNSNSTRLHDKLYDTRVAINQLVSPIIEQDQLPSLKRLNENPQFTKSSKIILHFIKQSKTCFEFSRVSNSEYSNNGKFTLLEEFGSNCISTAVLFTLEKWFDHLSPDSSSYIKLRLKSDLTLGLIIKNLDNSSTEVNRLSNYVASQLYKKFIGACVKDFGFDSILNPLCDIFHGIILRDYPIITKKSASPNLISSQPLKDNGRKNSNNNNNNNNDNPFFSSKEISVIDAAIAKPFVSASSSSHSHSHTHLNLESPSSPILHHHPITSTRGQSMMPDFPLSTSQIPIPPAISDHHISYNHHQQLLPNPPVLRSKQYTQVNIKFKDQELNFRYSIDSNAAPTIMELITNCKQAFGILNSTRILNLKDLRSGKIIKNDHDLERLLRMTVMLSDDGCGEVRLELGYNNLSQGFLNLNHEPADKTWQHDNISGNNNSNNNSSNKSNNVNSNISHDTNIENGTTNVSGDTMIGRYLPPPRPILPDTQPRPRGGFMKFQPLL